MHKNAYGYTHPSLKMGDRNETECDTYEIYKMVRYR